ncbi:MAG: hypothetical protein MHM6MM_003157 [Cercozoa sp. M6MM]
MDGRKKVKPLKLSVDLTDREIPALVVSYATVVFNEAGEELERQPGTKRLKLSRFRESSDIVKISKQVIASCKYIPDAWSNRVQKALRILKRELFEKTKQEVPHADESEASIGEATFPEASDSKLRVSAPLVSHSTEEEQRATVTELPDEPTQVTRQIETARSALKSAESEHIEQEESTEGQQREEKIDQLLQEISSLARDEEEESMSRLNVPPSVTIRRQGEEQAAVSARRRRRAASQLSMSCASSAVSEEESIVARIPTDRADIRFENYSEETTTSEATSEESQEQAGLKLSSSLENLREHWDAGSPRFRLDANEDAFSSRRMKRLEHVFRSDQSQHLNPKVREIPDYLEMLYEDDQQKQLQATGCLLQLAKNDHDIRYVIDNATLIGALTRILQEDRGKGGLASDITNNIFEIFLCISNFSQLHSILVDSKLGDACLRAIAAEVKKYRAQFAGASSETGVVANVLRAADSQREAVTPVRCPSLQWFLRQERKLYSCCYILYHLAEDIHLEVKMCRRKLVKFLAHVLRRTNPHERCLLEELQCLVLAFFRKLAVFGDNLIDFRKHKVPEAAFALCGTSNRELFFSALSFLASISFSTGPRVMHEDEALLNGASQHTLQRLEALAHDDAVAFNARQLYETTASLNWISSTARSHIQSVPVLEAAWCLTRRCHSDSDVRVVAAALQLLYNSTRVLRNRQLLAHVVLPAMNRHKAAECSAWDTLRSILLDTTHASWRMAAALCINLCQEKQVSQVIFDGQDVHALTATLIRMRSPDPLLAELLVALARSRPVAAEVVSTTTLRDLVAMTQRFLDVATQDTSTSYDGPTESQVSHALHLSTRLLWLLAACPFETCESSDKVLQRSNFVEFLMARISAAVTEDDLLLPALGVLTSLSVAPCALRFLASSPSLSLLSEVLRTRDEDDAVVTQALEWLAVLADSCSASIEEQLNDDSVESTDDFGESGGVLAYIAQDNSVAQHRSHASEQAETTRRAAHRLAVLIFLDDGLAAKVLDLARDHDGLVRQWAEQALGSVCELATQISDLQDALEEGGAAVHSDEEAFMSKSLVARILNNRFHLWNAEWCASVRTHHHAGH